MRKQLKICSSQTNSNSCNWSEKEKIKSQRVLRPRIPSTESVLGCKANLVGFLFPMKKETWSRYCRRRSMDRL